MKKQERMATPVKASNTGVSVNSQAGMKESRSDNFLTKQQKSTTFAKPLGSPLGKTYLSKSHENLSSHQKKKLATYIEHRPKSSLGLPKRDPASKYIGSSNKENLLVKDKDKGSGFLKPKPVKSGGLTPIRKASSTQNIDKTSSSSRSTHSNKMQSMKRAHSTHNVSKEKSSRKRTSAPADVMAYNAELLANFEKDKRGLESRISELIQVAENRKAEIEKYRYETKRLKEQIPSHDVKDELDFLRKENKLLQEQLRELGYPVEQITDSEKLSLLQQKNLAGKSSNKNGDVASCGCQIPKSKSCDSLSTDGARGLVSIGSQLGEYVEPSTSITASEPAMSLGDLCGTPEHPSMFSLDCGNWEKGSNKSSDALSEISVACLTERILQMEETHYSTNEELQATLQELGDLQSNVNELNSENERLHDEKYVLLESLCTQTEKLEHCRTQIEQLKALLISGNFPERSEREQQLLELLKGAQDEREELLYKQVELANAFQTLELERRETSDVADTLRDRLQLLDDKLNSVKAEKEADEKLIAECKTNIANDKIELDHYKTLLENEKAKVQELEKYCEASDSHSDVEQLLRNTRQEKDKLEEKLANMKESLLHGQCEITNLQELLNQKEEELKVCKNNAKTQISDYEFKIERLEKGKTDYHSEMTSMREHVSQLEHDCDQYLDEKKEYSKKLAELQVEMKTLQQEKVVRDNELSELRARHQEESEEWKQFQKDLQVAVLVANDFRAETQDDMDKLLQENSTMKEKCKLLEEENKKLQDDVVYIKSQKAVEEKSTPKSILSSAELKGKVLGTVDRELMVLRDKRQENKNQSQSVKSLIRSIEEQVKSGCSSLHSSSGNSRRNSDCSVDESLPGMQRLHQIIKSPTSPITDNQSVFNTSSPEVTLRSVLKKAPEKPSPLRHSVASLTFDPPRSPCEPAPKSAPPVGKNDSSPTITSILSRGPRRSSGVSIEPDRKDSATKDPLTILAKQMGGSKRNALLKWCQQKTIKYSGVDITNFSSSWNDGLAFCALLHSYLPDKIPYEDLDTDDKRRNFNMAFEAAESVGISSSILNINDMVAMERPDWQAVMAYVTSIYKHFEIDGKTESKAN